MPFRSWSKNRPHYTFEDCTNSAGGEYRILNAGKVEFSIPKDLIAQSRQEIDSWYEYLNFILGITCLGFALAVQGTPNPPFNAFVCLAFVQISHFAFSRNKFPSHLRNLRENKSETLRFLAKSIEGIPLSFWQTLKRAPLFLIGYVYLVFLALLAITPLQERTILDHTLANIFLPKDCVCRSLAH
jgi:hypothetical protein